MYFDDLKIGMTVDTAPTVIEKEKMMAFARTYDNIPLHINEEYAKTTPFGKLIAPGVMSFMSASAQTGFIHSIFVDLPANSSSPKKSTSRYFAHTDLSGKATITNLVKRNAKNGLVEVSIDAYNQNGELVLRDVTEAIVKCRPI